MSKGKRRDYFRYPQSEEDLVQFVIESEHPPLEPQSLFTEEELNQAFQQVTFDNIAYRIKRNDQCARILRNFASINNEIQILLHQTYVETINRIYNLTLTLVRRKEPAQEVDL